MPHQIMPALVDKATPIDQLHPHPDNARTRSAKAKRVIRESLEDNGQYKTVVARRLPDGTLQLMLGHGTVDEAAALGWTHVAADIHDDVDDTRARKIVAVDNRSSDLAGYDDDRLALLLAPIEADLQGSGFDRSDYDDLLAGIRRGATPATDPDDTPAPPVTPHCQVGDVWLLGPHRLAVGRAEDHLGTTVALDDVGVVLTDPPYGMRLEADWSTVRGSATSQSRGRARGKRHANVLGDHDDYDPNPIIDLVDHVAEQFWFGADYYAERLPAKNDGSWLVWDKRVGEESEAIGAEFELLWSRRKHKRRMLRHEWFGWTARGENVHDARNRVHPTQKPVTLFEDILGQWAPPGCVVLDPYAGSGSTLIACHRTGRVARLVELDCGYADVICRRFEEHTGIVPVLEETGVARSFT